MLRKILLGLTLFTVLVSCKKVDPELTAEITFKPKTSFRAVGTNDTAYVKTSSDGKADIIKFVSSDNKAVLIIQEGKDFVIFNQKNAGSNYFITAGLISSGQLKSQDTLWLKATGTGISPTKGDIAFISSSGLRTVNPANFTTTSISTANTYTPVSPCWTPDRKGILVNDNYSGGFYIYALNGAVISSGSSYSGSSSYYNSRFSLDGKAIYGFNPNGGYYIKDYNTKVNIILPIAVSNSSVYALAVGTTGTTPDNIAYLTYSGGYYRLYHYKNGQSTLIDYSSDGFLSDIAVSPNGQYVAYITKDNPTLKLYNRLSPSYPIKIDAPFYYGSYIRSPSFNSSSDQLTYSVQDGGYSGTSSTETIITYSINTNRYIKQGYGKQPSW